MSYIQHSKTRLFPFNFTVHYSFDIYNHPAFITLIYDVEFMTFLYLISVIIEPVNFSAKNLAFFYKVKPIESKLETIKEFL